MPKFKQQAQGLQRATAFEAAFGPKGHARRNAFAASPIEFSDVQDFVEYYGMQHAVCYRCHEAIADKGELDVQIALDGSYQGSIYTFHKTCEKRPAGYIEETGNGGEV